MAAVRSATIHTAMARQPSELLDCSGSGRGRPQQSQFGSRRSGFFLPLAYSPIRPFCNRPDKMGNCPFYPVTLFVRLHLLLVPEPAKTDEFSLKNSEVNDITVVNGKESECVWCRPPPDQAERLGNPPKTNAAPFV